MDVSDIKVKLCKNGAGSTPSKPLLHRAYSTGSNTRYALLNEGDVQICRINHHRSLLQKIIYSRPLRRWESHRIILSDNHLYSCSVRSVFNFSKNLAIIGFVYYGEFSYLLKPQFLASPCLPTNQVKLENNFFIYGMFDNNKRQLL